MSKKQKEILKKMFISLLGLIIICISVVLISKAKVLRVELRGLNFLNPIDIIEEAELSKYNKKSFFNIPKKEIKKYIEEINRKNYSLKIQNNTEDELSILQNELYKITIMLKEQAENSINDKMNLKDSLADISHQLKTPLTSIQIMLDNIIDDENMPQDIKNDFIKDIRSEIQNINVLVNTILKLSKLDTNTITMNKKKLRNTSLPQKSNLTLKKFMLMQNHLCNGKKL